MSVCALLLLTPVLYAMLMMLLLTLMLTRGLLVMLMWMSKVTVNVAGQFDVGADDDVDLMMMFMLVFDV